MKRAIVGEIAVVSLLALFACAPELADMEPESERAQLSPMVDGWPSDTNNGIIATGISRRTKTTSTREEQIAQAEHGALSRIFSQLRARGIPPTIAEETYYACLERSADKIYRRTTARDDDGIEVSIFIEERFVAPLMQCIKLSSQY